MMLRLLRCCRRTNGNNWPFFNGNQRTAQTIFFTRSKGKKALFLLRNPKKASASSVMDVLKEHFSWTEMLKYANNAECRPSALLTAEEYNLIEFNNDFP